MTMAKRSGSDIIGQTSGVPDFDSRCDCKPTMAARPVAGLETQEEADPWLVGRRALLDGEIVCFKVGCFEEDLTVLRTNAEVRRQNSGFRADGEVVRRAGLFRQSESTAGSWPKDCCARPSGRKGGPPE